MAENSKWNRNTKPQDGKRHVNSMEIPPQKPKRASENKPSTPKPAKK